MSTHLATFFPSFAPWTSGFRKWNPSQMRASIVSCSTRGERVVRPDRAAHRMDEPEADAVSSEEPLRGVHHRARVAVVARRVIGVAGGREQRQPAAARLGLRPLVPVGRRLADRGDRTPEAPVVLVVPAADEGVACRQGGHPEQPGVLGGRQATGRGHLTERLVHHDLRVAGEEHRLGGLLRGPARPVQGAHRPDFLVVDRVLAALEVVRALRAELPRVEHRERADVREPRERVTRIARQLGPPLAGLVSWVEREIARPAPVAGPIRQQDRRSRGPGRDPVDLGGTVRDPGQTRRVQGIKAVLDVLRKSGRDVDEHVMGRGRRCRVHRRRGGSLEAPEIRLMTAVDRIDRVVHGGMDHREIDRHRLWRVGRAGWGRRRAVQEGIDGVLVPLDNDVRRLDRRCGGDRDQTGRRDQEQRDDPRPPTPPRCVRESSHSVPPRPRGPALDMYERAEPSFTKGA